MKITAQHVNMFSVYKLLHFKLWYVIPLTIYGVFFEIESLALKCISNFAECLAIDIGAETPESSHYQSGDWTIYALSPRSILEISVLPNSKVCFEHWKKIKLKGLVLVLNSSLENIY